MYKLPPNLMLPNQSLMYKLPPNLMLPNQRAAGLIAPLQGLRPEQATPTLTACPALDQPQGKIYNYRVGGASSLHLQGCASKGAGRSTLRWRGRAWEAARALWETAQ